MSAASNLMSEMKDCTVLVYVSYLEAWWYYITVCYMNKLIECFYISDNIKEGKVWPRKEFRV